jgi:prepilin-type N-terminal cleavage/methylation domain-containing protein
MKNNNPNKESGFTLIELLVVIAIISILSAVTLGIMQDSRTKAQDAQIVRQVSEFQNAVALFVTSEGRYPVPTGSVLGDDNYTGGVYCIGPSGSTCYYLGYTINSINQTGDFAKISDNREFVDNTNSNLKETFSKITSIISGTIIKVAHASQMSDFIAINNISLPVIDLGNNITIGGGILYGCVDLNCEEAEVIFATNKPIRKGTVYLTESYNTVYKQSADDPGSGEGGSY